MKASFFFRSLLVGYAFVLLGFFLHLGLFGYISDSEIWSVTLAKNIKEEWFNSWVFTRPLFYLLLSVVEYFPNNAISIFESAKFLCLANGAAIVFLTYRITRTIAAKELATAPVIPYVAVILLLSNSGFINQGYRIRSDLFSCSASLLALDLTYSSWQRWRLKTQLFWTLPLLFSPKGIFQVFPFVAFPQPKKMRLIYLGLLILLAGSAAFFYPQEITYLLRSIFSAEEGGSFFSATRMHYLNRILRYNPLFALVFFLRFLFLGLRWRLNLFVSEEEKDKHRVFFRFTVLSIFMLAFLPHKVPFALAAFLPIFCIFSALICEDTYRIVSSRPFLLRLPSVSKKSPAVFLSFLLLMPLSALTLQGVEEWRGFLAKDNNIYEFTAIRILENYLQKFPLATYFDSIGIIPQRASLRFFAGPNDPYINQNTMEWLKREKPHLVFYVWKSKLLEPALSEYLKSQYFTLGSSVFARWNYLDKPVSMQNSDFLGNKAQEIASSLGAHDQKIFSFLLRAPKKEAWRAQFFLSELGSQAKQHKDWEVVAVSAFTDFPVPLPNLLHYFVFDGEY